MNDVANVPAPPPVNLLWFVTRVFESKEDAIAWVIRCVPDEDKRYHAIFGAHAALFDPKKTLVTRPWDPASLELVAVEGASTIERVRAAMRGADRRRAPLTSASTSPSVGA